MSEQMQNPGPRTSVTAATEADIQADLRELMIGPNFGAPTQAQQWGLTSQPRGQSEGDPSLAQLELQADIARQTAAANAFQSLSADQLPQEQPQAAHWQKLYGDSENEKGELRRQLEQTAREKAAQEEVMNQLLLSMQQGAAPQQSYRPGYANAGPNSNFGNYPQSDPFEGKDDNDVLSVRDVKRLVGEQIAPAFQNMQMQTMQMLDQQAATVKRASIGLTPIEEFMLTRENPWVGGLPSASQRLDALSALKKAKAATQPAPQAPAVAAQVATAPTIRRMTTTEQSTQQAPDFQGNATDAAFQLDFAKAQRLSDETGARAKAMRAIAEKYNMPIGKMSDMGLMRTQTIV